MKNIKKTITISMSLMVAVVSVSFFSQLVVAEEKADKTETASKKIPRLSDGKPDFTGVWINGDMGFVNPIVDESGSVVCIVGCPPVAKEGEAPPTFKMLRPGRPKYKPEYVAKVKELDAKQVEFDKSLNCGNPGLPRIGPPDAIVQRPGQIAFLYEDLSGSFFRIIPTDGRAHREDFEETYLGESVGKWEGDTLVIEAIGFNDETWLIDDGAFHTTDLKVTEKIRWEGNELIYNAIAEDPAVLVEPWHMATRKLVASEDPLPEPLPCVEMDLKHVIDGTSHDNAR